LPLNDALLLIISTNSIVIITELCTLHKTQKFLVVSDDNELEVRLRLSGSDNAVKGFSQASNIIPIEVGRRFVKRDKLYIIRS
jgi:hypothetical protein